MIVANKIGEIMGKKKKNRRPPQLRDEDLPRDVGVEFTVEANADEIFAEFISSHDVPLNEAEFLDEDQTPPRASKRRGSMPHFDLDLHGLHVDAACRQVEHFIRERLAQIEDPFTITIITGRGLHSGPGGGVLARDVYDYVRGRFLPLVQRMDEAPTAATLGGLPLRGYFQVTFKPKSSR